MEILTNARKKKLPQKLYCCPVAPPSGCYHRLLPKKASEFRFSGPHSASCGYRKYIALCPGNTRGRNCYWRV